MEIVRDDGDDRVVELTTAEQGEILMASNNARLQTLSHKGLGIDMQQLMVRHLVEVLFPTEELRIELNLSFQQMLSGVLDEAERQADARMLQVDPDQGRLLIPGQ